MELDLFNDKSNYIIGLYNIDLEDNKDIFYINDEMHTTSVLNEIKYYLNIKRIANIHLKTMIEDLLTTFKLDSNFLNKKIDELSYSEKIIVSILIAYTLDTKYIVIDDLYKKLDRNIHKKLKSLFINIKAQNRIIIINSSDIDLLYDLTDYIFLKTNKGKIKEGMTKEILKEYKMLVRNGIKVPTLIEITKLAKEKKNVKLFYHTDTRDIIKDIYKHV